MSDKSSGGSSGGVGFMGCLFILFLALKLTDVIDWSWWWVTAPIWGTVTLAFLGIFSIVFIQDMKK